MANTYSVSTTDQQDPLVSWIVAQYNAAHGTALTVQQYIQLRFPELLAPFQSAYTAAVSAQLQQKYLSATEATQQQVNTLLGLS